MSSPKPASIGVGIAVAALIVIAITSIGYYQFVYCAAPPAQNLTSPSAGNSTAGPAPNPACVIGGATSSTAVSCTPPKCLTIQVAPGAAALTTTAYLPDTVKLVMGVNNSVVFFNNDSSSGGVSHTATDRATPPSFNTGILSFGQQSSIITFTKPGNYSYYCEIHPTTMRGNIIVVAGTGASSSNNSTA